jgi:hypothetical protein
VKSHEASSPVEHHACCFDRLASARVQAPVAGGREPAQPFVITDVTLIGPVGSRGGGARLSKDGAEE